MLIKYALNPLETVVELSSTEQQLFLYRVYIKELEDSLFSAHYALIEGSRFNLEEARRELDPNYCLNYKDDNILDRVKMLTEWYLKALQHSHAGDCTCYPISCPKCYAEELLGINTLPYFSKYFGSRLVGKQITNLDDTINELQAYIPTATWNGWEAYASRWKQQATDATDWLIKYKDRTKCASLVEEITMIAP